MQPFTLRAISCNHVNDLRKMISMPCHHTSLFKAKKADFSRYHMNIGVQIKHTFLATMTADALPQGGDGKAIIGAVLQHRWLTLRK